MPNLSFFKNTPNLFKMTVQMLPIAASVLAGETARRSVDNARRIKEEELLLKNPGSIAIRDPDYVFMDSKKDKPTITGKVVDPIASYRM